MKMFFALVIWVLGRVALASQPASPSACQTTFASLIDKALIKYDVTETGPVARAWATYQNDWEAASLYYLLTYADDHRVKGWK